jgi:lysophospholipase L1-like esterase
MCRRLAAALAVLALLAVACPPSEAASGPLRILAVGDSITAGNTSTGSGTWQAELDRLLTAAGVPHVIETEALSGSRCDHWPPLIAGLLAAHHPGLLVFYCGTNDDPNAMIYGEPATGWAFRSVVEAAHASGAQVEPVLIGYSDAALAPDWLLANEPRTNDILWPQMARYLPPNVPSAWFPGVANIQAMPGTAEYLDGDGCDPGVSTCGIHPDAKGYRTVGRLVYDAAAPGMGWPPASAFGEPPLCGMSGHRKGYPRPVPYLACP